MNSEILSIFVNHKKNSKIYDLCFSLNAVCEQVILFLHVKSFSKKRLDLCQSFYFKSLCLIISILNKITFIALYCKQILTKDVDVL